MPKFKVGDIVTISRRGTRWCEIRNGDFWRDGHNPYGTEGEVINIKRDGLPIQVSWSNGAINTYQEIDLDFFNLSLKNK